MPIYARKATLVTFCAVACLVALTCVVPALFILDGIIATMIVLGLAAHINEHPQRAVRVSARSRRRRRTSRAY